MNGVPNMSDEQIREIAEDLKAYLLALLGLQRKAIVLGIKVLGGASAVGVLIGALVAMGQSVAIGFHAGWRTYGTWWLLSPLIGASAPIAFFIAGLIFYTGPIELERVLKARLSGEVRRVLGRVGMSSLMAMLIAMPIGLAVFLGYDSARRANELLCGSQLADLGAVTNAVGQQSQALTDLSRSGVDLLRSLDDVGQAIRGTREELATTLQTVEANAASAAKAAKDVADLAQKQKQVELRLGELQRLLDGGTPITKQDLESSNRLGLILGALLGFAASLAAAFSYSWLRRRMACRSTESD